MNNIKVLRVRVTTRYFTSFVDKTVYPIPIGHRVANVIICGKGENQS